MSFDGSEHSELLDELRAERARFLELLASESAAALEAVEILEALKARAQRMRTAAKHLREGPVRDGRPERLIDELDGHAEFFVFVEARIAGWIAGRD